MKMIVGLLAKKSSGFLFGFSGKLKDKLQTMRLGDWESEVYNKILTKESSQVINTNINNLLNNQVS